MIIALLSMALGQDLAIRGELVFPVSGPPIDNGVVLVTDGTITAVGADVQVPDGVEVVEGAVVTPGMIDGLSQVGLTGVFNSQRADQDHRERGRVHPELRAIDGYNPWEELVGWLRRHGVTTAQIGPSPGGVVAGRAAVVQTTADPSVVLDDTAVVFTLGELSKTDQGSRMGSAATVRQALADASEYRERRKLPLADRPGIDLGLEAMVEVLEGDRKAVIVAHRADDLLTALSIGREHDLDLVLAGATEGYLVREAIAAAKVPVLVGPVMVRAWSQESETANASFENAALLSEAGVPIGFTGGFEGYVPKVRVVLWEAAISAANGLGRDGAIAALTLGGASAIGVDDRLGTLEVGKQADLVVFDGDPFEYTSHVCTVVIRGQVVSDTCH